MENENKTNNLQEAGTENAPVENNNAAETEARTEGMENYWKTSDGQEDAAEKYENFAKTESAGGENFSSGEPMDFSGASSSVSSKSRLAGMLAKNKNKTVITVAAVLLVIAAAGAIYMLDSKKDAETLPPNGQDTIVESSFQAMKNIKSYTYDGKIKFTYTTTKGEPSKSYNASFETEYKGVSQKDKQEKRAFYSNITYNSAINVREQKSETSFDVESVSLDGKGYLRLNDFNLKGAGTDAKAAELENSLKEYKKIWYLTSSDDNHKFFEKMTNYFSLPVSIGSASEINSKNLDNFDKIFSNPGILKMSEKIGEENVGDADTVHYDVKLNSREALNVAAEIMRARKQQEGLDENGEKILAELEDNAENGGKLKDVIDYALNNINFEIWIGKNDNFIHRFQISGAFDKAATKEFASKLNGDTYSFDVKDLPDMDLNFSIDYTLTKFNASEVREPSDAKDFKEVMNKFEAAGPISSSAPSLAADSDGDGLSDEDEKAYGSDPQKADTDGDGYKDGDEVRNGYDPIVAGSARLDYSKLNKGK